MEVRAAMEGWTSRRKHRNGGFWLRAEIEVDRGSSIPRGPGFGFAAAVREPLVKLRRPVHDFERWDWDYFVWPHDRLDANLEMRDSDPEATLEADRKASESFLNKSTLQLESYEMYQHLLQQQASAWPCNPLNTNLEMRDSSIEGHLNQGTLQPESEMYQHTAALPRDHLIANLEVRNTDAEAKLQTDRKAKGAKHAAAEEVRDGSTRTGAAQGEGERTDRAVPDTHAGEQEGRRTQIGTASPCFRRS